MQDLERIIISATCPSRKTHFPVKIVIIWISIMRVFRVVRVSDLSTHENF